MTVQDDERTVLTSSKAGERSNLRPKVPYVSRITNEINLSFGRQRQKRRSFIWMVLFVYIDISFLYYKKGRKIVVNSEIQFLSNP